MKVPEAVRAHHGVVGLDAFSQAGISPARVRAAVRAGTIERVARGLFVVPERRDEWTSIVASLVTWPTAVLTGRSALRLHGCDGFDEAPDCADLRTLRKGSRAPYPAARRVDSDDIETIDGMRVLRPVPLVGRTVATIGADLAEAAIETFLRRCQLTEAELREACSGRRLTAGERSSLRAVMDRRGWGIPPTESYLETLTVQRVLRPAGLAHQRQVAIALGGAYLKRFDFQLESGLLINCHGMAFHTSAAAVQQDAAYGLRLRLAGLEVETVTWGDVTRRPAKTARDLATRSAQVTAAQVATQVPTHVAAGAPSMRPVSPGLPLKKVPRVTKKVARNGP